VRCASGEGGMAWHSNRRAEMFALVIDFLSFHPVHLLMCRIQPSLRSNDE